MIYAKDEQVIKSWDYAHGKFGLDKNVSDANLTITNKRIIHTIESKVSLSVAEVPLASVKSVDGSFKRNPSLGAILQIIFGIPLIIALGLGIRMIISGVKKLRAAFLTLNIVTFGEEGSTLSCGAASETTEIKKGSFFSRLFKTKKRIYVNKEMAKEILETIGAVILENKPAEAK